MAESRSLAADVNPPLPVRKLVGPCIGPESPAGAALEVEDRHDTIPNSLAAMFLMDRHRLDKRGFAAVLGFHGLLKLVGWDFDHCFIRSTTLQFEMTFEPMALSSVSARLSRSPDASLAANEPLISWTTKAQRRH